MRLFHWGEKKTLTISFKWVPITTLMWSRKGDQGDKLDSGLLLVNAREVAIKPNDMLHKEKAQEWGIQPCISIYDAGKLTSPVWFGEWQIMA